MNWLTLEDLIVLHARVLKVTGGTPRFVNPNGLESSLGRPFSAFGGREFYPETLDKIAAMMHSLIAFHPFVEANERLALVAADVCLRLNGQRISPSDAVESFLWSVARGEQSVEKIREWLDEHTEPWSEQE